MREPAVIELGDVARRARDAGPGRPGWWRRAPARVPVVAVVAAFALGLVAGAAAYHVREAQHRDRAEQEMSLLLSPGTVGVSRSDGRTVTYDAQVTAVNTGSAAIRVGDLQAQQDGFRLSGSPRLAQIRPGRVWTFNVTVTWDCAGRFPNEVLQVGLSVEQPGGRLAPAVSPLMLRDSGWREHGAEFCGRFG